MTKNNWLLISLLVTAPFSTIFGAAQGALDKIKTAITTHQEASIKAATALENAKNLIKNTTTYLNQTQIAAINKAKADHAQWAAHFTTSNGRKKIAQALSDYTTVFTALGIPADMIPPIKS